MADDRDEKGKFLPGNHNGGRPRGSRVKFADKLVKDFSADWDQHGAATIKTVREKNPTAYLTIASKLIPADYEARLIVEHQHSLSDPQLLALSKDWLAMWRARAAAMRDEPLLIEHEPEEEEPE